MKNPKRKYTFRKKGKRSSFDNLRNIPKRKFIQRDNVRFLDDPMYIEWRVKVYSRDNYTCKMPGCTGASKTLNAHHIKRWADHPDLRYDINNGITLCEICHKTVTGVEEQYEALFKTILFPGLSTKIYRIMKGLDEPTD